MARVCEITINPTPPPQGGMHLDEPRAHIFLGSGGDDEHIEGWYLDTGAMSHMTGRAQAFSDLDHAVQGTVRFSDDSIVSIEGRGIVEFTSKTGESIKLVGVLYIPRLNNSITPLGQLDERGCKVEIEKGLL
jgi:hypothetical protein